MRSRASLASAPHTVVGLGHAPDGLPLALSVSRRYSVREAVLDELDASAIEELAPPVRDAVLALERAVCDEARREGLIELGGTDVYLSAGTMGAIFGSTMLARLLGSQSPIASPLDGALPPALLAAPGPSLAASEPVTLMKSVGADRYLAVPAQDGPVFIAEVFDEEADVAQEALQPLRLEDLRSIDGARFWWRRGSRMGDGALADAGSYQRAVREADELAWSIERAAVGTALVELARSLETFHSEGRVHADVKPGNSILTAHGAITIDPIGVRIGERSPGATPGWAAPEQLLGRDVAAATDVYPLGLMLAQMLGAVIYGEERLFVTPIGGEAPRRIRLFGDPEVYLDPALVTGSARSGWSELIRRCVSFDPDDRPADAAAVADHAATLLEETPLTGRMLLSAGPGTLHRNALVDEQPQAVWVLEDAR